MEPKKKILTIIYCIGILSTLLYNKSLIQNKVGISYNCLLNKDNTK